MKNRYVSCAHVRLQRLLACAARLAGHGHTGSTQYLHSHLYIVSHRILNFGYIKMDVCRYDLRSLSSYWILTAQSFKYGDEKNSLRRSMTRSNSRTSNIIVEGGIRRIRLPDASRGSPSVSRTTTGIIRPIVGMNSSAAGEH